MGGGGLVLLAKLQAAPVRDYVLPSRVTITVIEREQDRERDRGNASEQDRDPLAISSRAASRQFSFSS